MTPAEEARELFTNALRDCLHYAEGDYLGDSQQNEPVWNAQQFFRDVFLDSRNTASTRRAAAICLGVAELAHQVSGLETLEAVRELHTLAIQHSKELVSGTLFF